MIAAPTVTAPASHADAAAFLVNATVRPGYDFPNADAALSYGRAICDKIAAGRSYADMIGDIKGDFMTSDTYQGSYLIAQAVNELRPEQIWQTRRSAAAVSAPTRTS